MPNQLYRIARVTDVQIGHALLKISEEFGPFDVNFNVMQQGLGAVRFPEQKAPATWQQLLKVNGELIDHFGGALHGVSFAYYRGGQSGDPLQKSPILDDLVIDLNGVDEQRMLVAAKILSCFRPVALPKSAKASDPIHAQQAIQEATFARLQKLQEDLFAQTIEVRRQLDESVREKAAELEATFDAKQQRAEQELENQRSKLLEQEEDLKRRAQELDDSDNTFARRKIRDGMLSDVTDRVKNFDVSEATRKARTPVLQGMYMLVMVFVGLMFWTGYELLQVRTTQATVSKIAEGLKDSVVPSSASSAASNASSQVLAKTAQLAQEEQLALGATLMHDASNERIALWIRLSLLTVGLVGSLIFYIRWQSRWAEQFATTEQSLKQFHLDVNRANWVVETCLEWRKETDSLIPTPLIESLTRGLFTRDDPSPQTLHPADELASALMGSASKLSLAVGDNKLEFDKPGKIPKSIPAPKAGA